MNPVSRNPVIPYPAQLRTVRVTEHFPASPPALPSKGLSAATCSSQVAAFALWTAGGEFPGATGAEGAANIALLEEAREAGRAI